MTRTRTLVPLALALGLLAGALVATQARWAGDSSPGTAGITHVEAIRLQAARKPIKNIAHHYTLPDISGGSFQVTFPGLPRGSYLATYNVPAAMSAAGGYLICYFTNPSGTNGKLLQYGVDRDVFQTVSASGVIVKRQTAVRLQCNVTGTITTLRPSGFRATVDFVKLDQVKNRAAGQPVTRPVPRGGITSPR